MIRKVLIFKETLLPPSETFILAQMNALTGYEAKLAGLERSARSLPLEQPLLLTDSGDGRARLRARLYRKTGIAPEFHRQARRFAPSIVHAHFASGGRSAIALSHALGVPLVVTLHGSDITVQGAAEKYQRLAKEASKFICVSKFIRDRAFEAGLPAEKLVVHYIGIDRTLFAPAPTLAGSDILFVGRLVEKKGCEYLLRAMQIVERKHPSARLTIIGDGPLRPHLEAMARELKIHCSFAGVLPAPVVREHLQRARIFCVPSVTASNGDSEGLPTVIAEAHASGLPVVGSDHAGIPEIIEDGVTGLLAPERDHQALANGLLTLLTDEALWLKFSRAAITRIATYFDLKVQTGLLEDIYNGALRMSQPTKDLWPARQRDA